MALRVVSPSLEEVRCVLRPIACTFGCIIAPPSRSATVDPTAYQPTTSSSGKASAMRFAYACTAPPADPTDVSLAALCRDDGFLVIATALAMADCVKQVTGQLRGALYILLIHVDHLQRGDPLE